MVTVVQELMRVGAPLQYQSYNLFLTIAPDTKGALDLVLLCRIQFILVAYIIKLLMIPVRNI